MNTETVKFLSQLKNASLGNNFRFQTNSNPLILRILKLLYKKGYILSFKKVLKDNFANNTAFRFFVHIRNLNGKRVFGDLKNISTPRYQKYYSIEAINRLSSRTKLVVFSTDLGLLTLEDCQRHHIGGMLLFVC